MRLLFLNTLYAPHIGGGAELVLRTQVEALAERGHEVTVLTIGPQRELRETQEGGVRIIRIPYQNRYFHLCKTSPPLHERLLWHCNDRNNERAARFVRDIARRIEPDIACCHNLAGWSISAWRELRALDIPIVQVLHDQYLHCTKSTRFRGGHNCTSPCLDCRLLRLGHARASSQLTAVVGVSRFILDTLCASGLFDDVPVREVIYNASPGGLPPLTRTRPPGSETPLRFGFIGNLSESKGIGYLLEEVSSSRLTGFELLVAGRGKEEYESHLRWRYASDERIRFLGFVKPQAFFDSIDVMIAPSLWHDTLPSVVFESLGYGVPVIAARRGGIPEMVSEGGNGLLFEPDQKGALLGHLSQVLADPLSISRLAANCRASSVRFFDVPAWITALEAVFAKSLQAIHPRRAARATQCPSPS